MNGNGDWMSIVCFPIRSRVLQNAAALRLQKRLGERRSSARVYLMECVQVMGGGG